MRGFEPPNGSQRRSLLALEDVAFGAGNQVTIMEKAILPPPSWSEGNHGRESPAPDYALGRALRTRPPLLRFSDSSGFGGVGELGNKIRRRWGLSSNGPEVPRALKAGAPSDPAVV
jgi:hypothetical protein